MRGEKREILALMSIALLGKPDSGLGLCGRGAGRTEQGQKNKDENIAPASSEWIRERVQTCKQKTAVLQGKALRGKRGKWKALSVAEVEALCKCPSVLLTLFLLNHCPVQRHYLL